MQHRQTHSSQSMIHLTNMSILQHPHSTDVRSRLSISSVVLCCVIKRSFSRCFHPHLVLPKQNHKHNSSKSPPRPETRYKVSASLPMLEITQHWLWTCSAVCQHGATRSKPYVGERWRRRRPRLTRWIWIGDDRKPHSCIVEGSYLDLNSLQSDAFKVGIQRRPWVCREVPPVYLHFSSAAKS